MSTSSSGVKRRDSYSSSVRAQPLEQLFSMENFLSGLLVVDVWFMCLYMEL